jgi:YgiT-type zinc finger domain-containing protein
VRPFKTCPVCGGELEEKIVDKLLRDGRHTASLWVHTEVCLHCGERLYNETTVMRFERIRSKLKREELSEFQAFCQSFSVGTSNETVRHGAA